MKKLLSYDFVYIQDINPILDESGKIQEYSPQENYSKKDSFELNKHGSGTFCKFSIHSKWSGVAGVYAFFIDDILVYIGQAADFAQRFNMGYGNISPKNCFIGGQSTNCKINKMVLDSIKSGHTVSVYFHRTHDYNKTERELIKYYKPQYNTALNNDLDTAQINTIRNQTTSSKQAEVVEIKNKSVNPSVSKVREFIQKEIEIAKAQGKKDLVIRSGDIHQTLKMANAMPTVCSAMRTLDGEYKYEVIEEPPKGNGSRLVFKYIFN